jgi:hypothetical protein
MPRSRNTRPGLLADAVPAHHQRCLPVRPRHQVARLAGHRNTPHPWMVCLPRGCDGMVCGGEVPAQRARGSLRCHPMMAALCPRIAMFSAAGTFTTARLVLFDPLLTVSTCSRSRCGWYAVQGLIRDVWPARYVLRFRSLRAMCRLPAQCDACGSVEVSVVQFLVALRAFSAGRVSCGSRIR